MIASLDTNVIIHFYRAGLQNILFEIFEDGVIIYEQIRKIELENHGMDILELVDADIASGKIQMFTMEKLRKLSVHRIFEKYVSDNKLIFKPGDMGEVYAISLDQTMGVYSLVTDDIKQGGPYMSLLQFNDEIMPFTFADVLILRFLFGYADAKQTIEDFDLINDKSELKWTFKSQIKKFIKRFWNEPYRSEDCKWIDKIVSKMNISVKAKFRELQALIK